MTDKNKLLITASIMLSLAGTGYSHEIVKPSLTEPVEIAAEIAGRYNL